MKINKIIIVFIAIFLILLVGYLINIENDGDKIVVEKQVIGSDKYKLYYEITDSKEVKDVKTILKRINWENAKVSMAYPPQYKFHFEHIGEDQKAKELIYELWISPNKDKIELVIDNEGKYIQLSKKDSEELFKIITCKSLGDD
ncbi:hypothetical protein JK636_01695 [Clostridium sp. YIM B02515]|uniref:YhfM-like domain-containing protein n=1 Tax=Clostridium rhizosphaerae TaxID=2803861 RepID=A0ABS1T5R5_9CLOT|nr:hypothetical protein [Clostridium rhizosphaerae]MBL4934467.1 hypothetical protein [Clostridium rhizosphaerae]